MTADDKYSCRNMQNFLQQLQTLLSEKRKTFSGFFIAFLKCEWNLEHFEKKDECPSLIISELYCFGKRLLLKRLEGLASEHHSVINVLTDSNTAESSKAPLLSFFPWISDKLSWKKTALLWSKILRLFANTLTADDKYSCRNMQNFLQQLQTLYLKNGRLFLDFLLHFWNVDENYNILKKRMSVLA